jgi:patatin-like phospholipase/acyl hydrolase
MKVLSFDGGGIKGVFSLQILKRILQQFPDFLDKTDMLAGTSTGGLIALSLANGQPIDKILNLYLNGGDIFIKNFFSFDGVFKCKYDNCGLKKQLEILFGQTTLGQLKKKVIISAFDCDGTSSKNGSVRRWHAKFYTNINPTDDDCKEFCLNVGLYTSAAPTYFPLINGKADGGLVVNNPSAAAIHQLISNRPACAYLLKDIYLMALGTSTKINYLNVQNKNWGTIDWMRHILDILFDGMVDVADFQCQSMLWDRYHRVNAFVKDLPEMDDWKKTDIFVKLADLVDLNSTFNWINKNWK